MTMRVKFFFCVLAYTFILLFHHPIWGHEVVGEVTPLMKHANHILIYIEKGKREKAIDMAERIYEDFQEPGRKGLEGGLKTNAVRVDHAFDTHSFEMITQSIQEKDLFHLKKAIEWLSFLLMLEKLGALNASFEKKNGTLTAQVTIFWLGRNYFSYLLEPSLGAVDPIEEKRIDRLFDQMLYCVEDGQWEKCDGIRKDVIQGIGAFFRFPIERLTEVSNQKRFLFAFLPLFFI